MSRSAPMSQLRRLTSRELAGWALGLSVLPCFAGVPGLLTGISALRRLRQEGGRGRVMAWSAVGISMVWLTLAVLAVVHRSGGPALPEGHASSDYSMPAPNTSASLLTPGDCIKGIPPEDSVSYMVDRVPCKAAHDQEVFARFDLPPIRYPGDRKVTELASQGCATRFTTYVGADPANSTFTISMAVPVERTWVSGRNVTCFLQSAHPTRGSAKAQGPTRVASGDPGV